MYRPARQHAGGHRHALCGRCRQQHYLRHKTGATDRCICRPPDSNGRRQHRISRSHNNTEGPPVLEPWRARQCGLHLFANMAPCPLCMVAGLCIARPVGTRKGHVSTSDSCLPFNCQLPQFLSCHNSFVACRDVTPFSFLRCSGPFCLPPIFGTLPIIGKYSARFSRHWKKSVATENGKWKFEIGEGLVWGSVFGVCIPAPRLSVKL